MLYVASVKAPWESSPHRKDSLTDARDQACASINPSCKCSASVSRCEGTSGFDFEFDTCDWPGPVVAVLGQFLLALAACPLQMSAITLYLLYYFQSPCILCVRGFLPSPAGAVQEPSRGWRVAQVKGLSSCRPSTLLRR